MTAELTPEMRVVADTARTMIHSWVAKAGRAPAKILAAQTLWVLGETLAEYFGRAEAVRMMDASSDALNALAETAPTAEHAIDPGMLLPAGTMLVRIPTTAAEVDQLLRFFYGMRVACDAPKGEVVA